MPVWLMWIENYNIMHRAWEDQSSDVPSTEVLEDNNAEKKD